MNTGQTILAIFAFVLLTTVLVNFYRSVSTTNEDIASGQDGILATTISTSYTQIAQGLAFDQASDSASFSNTEIDSTKFLTPSASLGFDHTWDTTLATFDDFDDFRGRTNGPHFYNDKVAGGTGRTYRTLFDVYYVSPTNIKTKVNYQTFVKRMDLTTWRIFPPPGEDGSVDTLKMSLVVGYHHFN